MLKWKKARAGLYVSGENDCFEIRSVWNRIYGDHWELTDLRDADNYPKNVYIYKTLVECKVKAEYLK